MLEKGDLVSVVIPAYNTEKYIKPMIESLKAQSYQNLQIIFVDDGSCDGTAEIIKEYQSEDHRVEYYYQKNQGVSIARNNGLKRVKGKKLFFFDSDDTFENDLIESCVNFAIAQSVDAVLYGYADKVLGKKENEHVFELHGSFRDDQIAKEVIPSFLGHSYEDVNEWLKGKRGLRAGKEHTALWRIMLDVETIKKNNLQFDASLSLGEDTKFINTYLLFAESIGVQERTLYYLTIREGSANVTSNENPILMTRNKIKLIDARKQIDSMAMKGGVNTNEFWQGTLIFSAVQLALRLSHNSKASSKENYAVYVEYLNNPDVQKAVKNYPPVVAVKALPFYMLKWHMGKLLFHLCKLLPESVMNRF